MEKLAYLVGVALVVVGLIWAAIAVLKGIVSLVIGLAVVGAGAAVIFFGWSRRRGSAPPPA